MRAEFFRELEDQHRFLFYAKNFHCVFEIAAAHRLTIMATRSKNIKGWRRRVEFFNEAVVLTEWYRECEVHEPPTVLEDTS